MFRRHVPEPQPPPIDPDILIDTIAFIGTIKRDVEAIRALLEEDDEAKIAAARARLEAESRPVSPSRHRGDAV